LVGPAVLWADPASVCFSRRRRPMTKPTTNRTRRNGAVRCAIYTRKSSEEGLEHEFNSLQAQREACEAFIDSQRHEGWVCLPARYDEAASPVRRWSGLHCSNCSPTSWPGGSTSWSSTRSTG
jgi:hypothetical protein